MKLKVINSSSAGNCYLLESSDGEVLMIECGVRFDKIKKALGFNLDKVACCLITHSHKDHCSSVNELLKSGIKVFASGDELNAMGVLGHHNAKAITGGEKYFVGSFGFQAYDVVHDTPDPIGFLIVHHECGVVLFLTDTIYSPYTFKGLNNLIIEANYCEDILEERFVAGSTVKHVRDRVIESHLSIQNCITLLRANDLSRVNNIVLIHLSDNHSDAVRFEKEIRDLTGKNVFVADTGMEIMFNKTAF